MITLKNVKKYYKDDIALDIELLQFPDNGLVFICGDSGCGKTTLLNIIAGFDNEFKGKVVFSNLNKHIAYSNQKNILFKSETVLTNLSLCGNYSKQFLIKYAKKFNLNENNLNTLAANLSGGEQARLCLAMNLLIGSDVLLCDEITSGLDLNQAHMIMDILKLEAKTKLVICVSHNVELVQEYGDDVIYLENSKRLKYVSKKSEQKNKPITKYFKIFNIKNIFKLIVNKLKYKKIRTGICISTLTIGLVCFCLSIIVSSSIKNNFHSIFSKFWDKDQILMKRIQVGEASLVNTPLLEYEEILNKNKKHFSSISAFYLNNFESVLDVNEVHLRNDKKMLINDLSLFSINNYELVETHLDNDQIILGINDVTIRNICSFLRLDSYNLSSLNKYLSSNKLLIEFHVKKDQWNYEDSVTFLVKEFIFNDSTKIFHSNSLFNEYIFENLMRFKDKEFEINDMPWGLDKQYYLNCYDGEAFMKESDFDDDFRCIIPDYFQNDHHKIILKSRNIPVINQNDLNIIKQITEVDEFKLGYNANYQIFEDAMISGFSSDLLLSTSDKILDEVIELNSTRNINERNKYPNNIGYANVANFSNNSFNFSLNKNDRTMSDDEIILSSSLMEFLDVKEIGSYIYVGFLVSSFTKENLVYNSYTKSKLKVVGVIESEEKEIYHDAYWLKRFLRNNLGVSNYDLIVENVQIKLKDSSKSEDTIEKLNNIDGFEFKNMTGELTKTIDDVLNVVEIVLLCFSLFVIFLSIIMLLLIIYLFLQESVNDFIAIYAFGGTRKDVRLYKLAYILILIFRSFFVTLLTLGTLLVTFNAQNNPLICIEFGDVIKSIGILSVVIIIICLLLMLFLKMNNKKEHNLATFLRFYK